MEEFYEENPDTALRLGDILTGTPLASPSGKAIPMSGDYRIDILSPKYVAVMSPCCSIGDKMINLCSLLPIKSKHFDNPYFAEDMTRINRQMDPQQAFAPEKWAALPAEQQESRMAEGFSYALVDFFIYSAHDLLETYSIPTRGEPIETRIYMVDFRHITRITCDQIVRAQTEPFSNKLMQLSIEARGELRRKIVNYYSRVPREDQTGE